MTRGRVVWRAEYALAPPVFATRLVYLATLVLLPPFLLERGIAPASIGLVVGVYGYAAVAMDLAAGALADRFSPARLAAAGSGGVLGAIVLLIVAPSLALVAAARLLHGVAMGLFRPSVAALQQQRVPAERRASALSTNNLAYVGGAFAGPLLAGLLADQLGVRWALAACAAISALAAGYFLAVFAGYGGGRSHAAGPPSLLDWRSRLSHRAAYPRSHAASPPSLLHSLCAIPRLVGARSLAGPLILVLADVTILHAWLVYLPLWLIQQ